MNTLNLIELLKKMLALPLPGKAAQHIMAPNIRHDDEYYPSRYTAKQSAIMIILYPKDNKWHIPLIKRSEYNGPHSGQISFPGGKFEKTDDNYLATAFRETWEEIGIKEEDLTLLGKLTELYIPNSNFNVHPFVAYCSQTPQTTPDKVEVKEIIEVSLDAFMNNENLDYFIKEVKGKTMRAPFFNINNNTIWGATAMMMSELIFIIQNQLPISSHSYNAQTSPKSQ